MKTFCLIAALAGSVWIWTVTTRPSGANLATQPTGVVTSGTTAPPKTAMAAKSKARPAAQPAMPKLSELSTKIESLQVAKAELRHALERQGFPDVLAEGRLSAGDRSEILRQLSQLNDMDIQLARMKTRKVELETEVTP